MRLSLLAFAAAAFLAACSTTGGRGAVENYLEVCSDSRRSPAEALRFCRRALDSPHVTGRTRALTLMNAGIAAYALGEYRDTIAYQTEALQLAPGLAAAHVSRAQAYALTDRLREAVDDYSAAIEADPRMVEAYLGRGQLLRERGAPDNAVQDLSRAIDLAPARTAAWFERGSAYFALGRYRLAVRDFSEVVEREPDNAEAWLNRAQSKVAGNFRGAEGDFARAIELAPEWGGAYYARGLYLERRRRTDAANADFMRAFELGVSDPALIERVRRLSGG